MATQETAEGHGPINFIQSVLSDNSIALSETSDTISEKWFEALQVNPIWSTLLNDSPFKLMITRVSFFYNHTKG